MVKRGTSGQRAAALTWILQQVRQSYPTILNTILQSPALNDDLTEAPLQNWSPEGQGPNDIAAMCNDSHEIDLHISTELEAHLLDLYFTWEQPWYQVVDESLFRESKANKGRHYDRLLMLCICGIASRYSDNVEVRADPNDPDSAGRFFLEAAESLLPSQLQRPGITTIQSLAILGTLYVVSHVSHFLLVTSSSR